MKPEERGRLAEVDRSQTVRSAYSIKEGRLQSFSVNWEIPQWDIQKKLVEWEPIADGYRKMWGAFQEERLLGFAVYRSRISRNTGLLALLHVDRGSRGRGIGSDLFREVLKQARLDGNRYLYVSSIPTADTVNFYRSRGFSLAETPDRTMLELEPDDIHMVMQVPENGPFTSRLT